MNLKSWQKLLTFLRTSKIHLFLRLINTNLQIIVNDSDPNHEKDDDHEEHWGDNKKSTTNPASLNATTFKLECAEKEETFMNIGASLNLKSLSECIENVIIILILG